MYSIDSDEVVDSFVCRVIAPSRTLKIIDQETREIAVNTLNMYRISTTYSKFCEESNEYFSSSIQNRVSDIHSAFLDPEVKLILTAIGGFNSIQVIDQLNYDFIVQNPKFICGYSDVTVLLNAIHKKTGIITYYGPHFSTFGMKLGNEFTIKNFLNILNKPSIVQEVDYSLKWSEDEWFLDQKNRSFKINTPPVIIQSGEAEGELIGGNINSFSLLNGTEYQPTLKNKILFLESDGLSGKLTAQEFDRRLDSILLQKGANHIKGLVIGRFKTESLINVEKIKDIVKNKNQLKGCPVVYGYDFGHTMPMITIPIGGYSYIQATSDTPVWKFLCK